MASRPLVSLVIPCCNEQEVIEACHARVSGVIAPLPYDFEFIYIDDGSKDSTAELLSKIHSQNDNVVVVMLSRNFGQEFAIAAGLDNTSGDAVIILDADMQDPPELIPEMIRIWQEQKADVVYGQRVTRAGETWFKKWTAGVAYKVINFISDVDIPVNTGYFRLMSRRAVNAIIKLREHHRFMKGLFAWIGYKQVALHYDREPRLAGTTKWNFSRLWNHALEGMTGFSMTPLRMASLFGLAISIFAFFFGSWILVKTLTGGSDIPGYASIMVMVTFLSGIQLFSIGVLGEYVGRIFGETKNRPLYFIHKILEKPGDTP
jgi:glycosyltransferase involved in cell wall biosynthesis